MSATCPEYAFEIELSSDNGEETANQERALVRIMERQGLLVSFRYPGGRRFVVVREGSQATEADRETLRQWAGSQHPPIDVVIGPLVDLLEYT